VDTLMIAPTLAVGADVGFALGRNAEVTIAARYDHVFEQRGDTKTYEIGSGAQTGSFVDASSGGLRSAEVTAGIRGMF
jgi:plasminogen activator